MYGLRPKGQSALDHLQRGRLLSDCHRGTVTTCDMDVHLPDIVQLPLPYVLLEMHAVDAVADDSVII